MLVRRVISRKAVDAGGTAELTDERDDTDGLEANSVGLL